MPAARDSFEIASHVDFTPGVSHVFRPESDFDTVLPEDLRHLEPGNASQACSLTETDFVSSIEGDGCREPAIRVALEVVPKSVLNGVALVLEDASVDAALVQLVKVLRKGTRGSRHAP